MKNEEKHHRHALLYKEPRTYNLRTYLRVMFVCVRMCEHQVVGGQQNLLVVDDVLYEKRGY